MAGALDDSEPGAFGRSRWRPPLGGVRVVSAWRSLWYSSSSHRGVLPM
jgi:hypothetical protein